MRERGKSRHGVGVGESDGASWEDEDRGFGLVLTLGDSGLTSAREWPGKREQAGGIES